MDCYKTVMESLFIFSAGFDERGGKGVGILKYKKFFGTLLVMLKSCKLFKFSGIVLFYAWKRIIAVSKKKKND